MRTIKVTVIPEQRNGMNFELSTEAIVDEDMASTVAAGIDAAATVFAFMQGFGSFNESISGNDDDESE